MLRPEDYESLLVSKGIPLSVLGLREVALRREDALQAVAYLRATKIPILGGDVYFRRGLLIELAYANWHAEPKPEDDKRSYLRRTWEVAEIYITEFPAKTDKETLFVLVTGQVLGPDA